MDVALIEFMDLERGLLQVERTLAIGNPLLSSKAYLLSLFRTIFMVI